MTTSVRLPVIGFIDLGVIGRPMDSHLADADADAGPSPASC